MKGKKRTIFIAILLIFFTLFFRIFVIAESNHDCIGDDCPICEMVAVLENSIKDIYLAKTAIAVFGALVFAIVKALFLCDKNHSRFTLTKLKVKLSN